MSEAGGYERATKAWPSDEGEFVPWPKPWDECAEGDRERPEGDEAKGDRLKAGISEVLDGGQQVIVLFSVVNTSKHTILLMPPPGSVRRQGTNRGRLSSMSTGPRRSSWP